MTSFIGKLELYSLNSLPRFCSRVRKYHDYPALCKHHKVQRQFEIWNRVLTEALRATVPCMPCNLPALVLFVPDPWPSFTHFKNGLFVVKRCSSVTSDVQQLHKQVIPSALKVSAVTWNSIKPLYSLNIHCNWRDSNAKQIKLLLVNWPSAVRPGA